MSKGLRVYELIFLFTKQLEVPKEQRPTAMRFIIGAYNAVLSKIKLNHKLNSVITSKHISALDITEHMKDKLNTLLRKKLTVVERKQLDKSRLLDELTSTMGIGREKANQLIKMGLTKSTQLKQKKYVSVLPDSVIMFMKYKPLKLMAHKDIKKIEPKLIGFKKASATIVGGYLRKKPFSKDIDVMLVSTNSNILDDYITYLETKFKNVVVYLHGTHKVSLIILITGKIYYKLDVFRSLPTTQYSMLLYSTGSKQFNIRMRAMAKRKGYLLNQNGLFKKNSKTPIAVTSEQDFFKILGMRYTPPHRR